MKKTLSTLILISLFGLKIPETQALDLFDFKACTWHGADYTLVLNEQDCPYSPSNPPPPGFPPVVVHGYKSINNNVNKPINFKPYFLKEELPHRETCFGEHPGSM